MELFGSFKGLLIFKVVLSPFFLDILLNIQNYEINVDKAHFSKIHSLQNLVFKIKKIVGILLDHF